MEELSPQMRRSTSMPVKPQYEYFEPNTLKRSAEKETVYAATDDSSSGEEDNTESLNQLRQHSSPTLTTNDTTIADNKAEESLQRDLPKPLRSVRDFFNPLVTFLRRSISVTPTTTTTKTKTKTPPPITTEFKYNENKKMFTKVKISQESNGPTQTITAADHSNHLTREQNHLMCMKISGQCEEDKEKKIRKQSAENVTEKAQENENENEKEKVKFTFS